MAYEEENKNRLEELNGSNFKIIEGEPDITGWEVIDAEGRVIGEVDDVLFDPQSRSVRYMIVDLSENELDIDVDKRVLIPIGLAELPVLEDEIEELEEDDSDLDIDQPYGSVRADEVDEDEVEADDDEDDEEEVDEVVYLPTVTVEHLLAIPAYDKDSLTPEYETSIRSVFETPVNDTAVAYHQDTFYSHEHFNNKIYPRSDQEASDELDRSDLPDQRNEYRDPNKNIL